MTGADYTVLVCYLAGIFAVGVIVGVRNKSAAEMFAAGGQSPWWTSGLSGFMTMFSAGTFVVWGGIAYKHGLVAVAINLCYGIAAILVGYFVAGRWKALGVGTPAEFIEIRYSRGVLHFITWSMMVFRLVSAAVALYSLATLMVALMPLPEGYWLSDPATGHLSVTAAVILFGGIVVLYTMIGGLWGVLMTDVLQFIVLNLAVLFVVPLGLAEVGGLGSFIAQAPADFFLPTSSNYTWFFLAAWVAIHCFQIGAEWAFVQRYLCVPAVADARKAAYLFGVLYLVSPWLWLLPPMLYRIQAPLPVDATAAEVTLMAEQAYIQACRSVLPSGMVGLMIAAMFSATASMISSQLNVFAGVLTSDLYRPWTQKSTTAKHLVWAGRSFTLLLGMGLIGMALAIPSLGGAEQVIVALTSLVVGPLLAPILWGLFSQRIRVRAVWRVAWWGGFSGAIWLLLQHSCGEAGWLADSDAWSQSATWVRDNVLTHDNSIKLFIGVVLPIAVLSLAQRNATGTDIGWTRLLKLKASRADQPARHASGMPAQIVAWSLAASGLMMAILAMDDGANRGILGGFAAVLGLLAVTIGGFSSRITKGRMSEETYLDA